MNYKLYYKEESGIVCELPPYNYSKEDGDKFIEVDKNDYQNAHLLPYGKVWKVIDDKLQLVDDETTQKSNAYQLYELNNELAICKGYLTQTDYVVIKLSELKLEDEESYEEEKAKYTEVLEKRKENREKINEIEKNISNLENLGLKWE